MFEKEAEERAERKISNFIPQQWGVSLIRTEQSYETVEGAPHFYLRSLAKMWKEGAEYGYNKAKVEVEDSYWESLCNSELNLASVIEQLEELEKANKWHYPSKGELPKCNEETQLMFYVNCYYNLGDEIVTKKRMVLGYYKKAFLRDDVKLFVEKSRGYEDEHLPQAVIAWKEIVLPELEESETNG